jgi:hypothetical protein
LEDNTTHETLEKNAPQEVDSSGKASTYTIYAEAGSTKMRCVAFSAGNKQVVVEAPYIIASSFKGGLIKHYYQEIINYYKTLAKAKAPQSVMIIKMDSSYYLFFTLVELDGVYDLTPLNIISQESRVDTQKGHFAKSNARLAATIFAASSVHPKVSNWVSSESVKVFSLLPIDVRAKFEGNVPLITQKDDMAIIQKWRNIQLDVLAHYYEGKTAAESNLTSLANIPKYIVGLKNEGMGSLFSTYDQLPNQNNLIIDIGGSTVLFLVANKVSIIHAKVLYGASTGTGFLDMIATVTNRLDDFNLSPLFIINSINNNEFSNDLVKETLIAFLTALAKEIPREINSKTIVKILLTGSITTWFSKYGITNKILSEILNFSQVEFVANGQINAIAGTVKFDLSRGK